MGMTRGRPKQFYKHELPTGIVKVVRAQCADYQRKKLALRTGALPLDVLKTYEDTNAAIDDALSGIEEGCRFEFLVDIAENRGYDRSQINWLVSEGAYYNRKRQAIYDIAHRLHLI